MSTERVDFLFRGSHPAFFWAAALLKQKGMSVAILPEPALHAWEVFPREILSLIGLDDLVCDRNQNPIQILTSHCRMGILQDLEGTLKDYELSVGERHSAEILRGLSYYAKGSDYPAVYGESFQELIRSGHEMVYFENSPAEIQSKAVFHIKKIGVHVLLNSDDLPIAEQTVILDSSRAKIFRCKYEIEIPMDSLPVGASPRMLLVERNSPLIEMIHRNGKLVLRTLLPEEESLPQKMLNAIQPYFRGYQWNMLNVMVVPRQEFHLEWAEHLSNVDSSRLGTWLISPAINPEWGERSLYVRISDLLRKKDKKKQLFEKTDLFA